MNFLDVRAEPALTLRMDYRPLRADLSWKQNCGRAKQIPETPAKVPMQRFSDENIRAKFQQYTALATWEALDLSNYERALLEIASVFHHIDPKGDATMEKQVWRKNSNSSDKNSVSKCMSHSANFLRKNVVCHPGI